MDDLEDKDNFLIKFDQDVLKGIKQANWDDHVSHNLHLRHPSYDFDDQLMDEPEDACFGNKLGFGIELSNQNPGPANDNNFGDGPGLNLHQGIQKWKSSCNNSSLKQDTKNAEMIGVENSLSSEHRVTKRARIDSGSFINCPSETGRSNKDLSVEKKKELNRKSASQCRKKRKEYVTQLEKRVSDLESEVHGLKRKLRFYEQNEKLNTLSQKESILQYLTGKYDEYDKLDSLIQEYDESDQKSDELCNIISTIKSRQGSQGYVRKQTVNYLLKKVIEKIMPSHVKYIIASCSNENGYFEKARGRKLAKNLKAKTQRGKYNEYAEKCQDPDSYVWKEIIYTIGLNSDEIKLLKKQRSKILKCRERFSNHLQKFLKIKKELFKISTELEITLDDVGKNVRPIQIARFLKYVDRIKHKKELSVFDLWGVKPNKFRVKFDKIGTDEMLSPPIDKKESTITLIKKKEKKKMQCEAESKINEELERTKKLFESNHGIQSSCKVERSMSISPEDIANEILQNEERHMPGDKDKSEDGDYDCKGKLQLLDNCLKVD